MLLEQDAIRVETEVVAGKRGQYNQKIYIFACSGCGKEMRKRRGALKTHTGLCVRCVKRTGHPLRTLYNVTKTGCLRENERSGRDCPFLLSFDEFVFLSQIRMCAYCGGTVNWKEWGPGPGNLDRKDHRRGYEMDNIVVACWECNYRKGAHYTFEEFLVVSTLLRVLRAGDIDECDRIHFDLLARLDELSRT